MRLISVAAVLTLIASPALACGPGPTSRATAEPEPSKAELERRAKAEQAEEAAMLKKGFVKAYTFCGPGNFIWVKKDAFGKKPAA